MEKNTGAYRSNNLVSALSSIATDHQLRSNMMSYAIDTNVIADATGISKKTDESNISQIKETLSKMKITIYQSILNEYSGLFSNLYDFEKKLAFELFKENFDRPQIRIVDDQGYFDAHMDVLMDKNLEVAEQIKKYTELGIADCHLMVQAAVEGNTVYTGDRGVVRACKNIGIPVLYSREDTPVEYQGKWIL